MKSIKYLKLFLMTLVLGLTATSCMDDDWKDPTGDTPAFGNNNLVEAEYPKLLSIAELKKKYGLTPENVNNHINDTMRIENGLQIKGVVTGHDVEGNLYNEIAVDDGTAGIIICIAQGGLCGQLQIGQEILIDLGGLYIGAYRSQPQIGVPYTSTSASGAKSTYPSRIARNDWQNRFKLLGAPDASKIKLQTFDISQVKDQNYVYSMSGRLVKVSNISFDKADGKTTFAPEEEGKTTGFGVMRSFKGYTTNEFGIRTSCYADFAAMPLPSGNLNVTGVLTCYKSSDRYNATVQLLLRQYSDIEVLSEAQNK
jgi:hypothetical protein